jgi:predicted protein tyrosine phosphatase
MKKDIKAIEVRNLTEARLFECGVPWAAISIVSSKGGNPILTNLNRKGLLNMAFADIEFARDDIEPEMVFDQVKAKQILDFVAEMWPQVECFLVHCHAGMSRSPAVAAAIEHIYHGNRADEFWFKTKTPNMLVYRTLLNEHYGIENNVRSA